MAGFRFSVLKSLSPCIKPSCRTQYFQYRGSSVKSLAHNDGIHARALSFAFANHYYHTLESRANTPYYRTNHVNRSSPTLPNVCLRSNLAIISASPVLNYRSYVSYFGGKGDKPSGPKVPAASDGCEPNIDGNDGIIPSDWVDRIKDGWKSMVDAAIYTEQKAKEVSNELTPYAHQLLDSHPYLNNVIIPVSFTFTATILAWLVMPRVLRRFHKYAMQSSATLLPGGLFGGQVPYEKSLWGALEDPVRYLITFMAFSQIAMMIAPTSIALTYIPQVWRGAVILSFVWFLHRWKTNVFSFSVQSISTVDREKLLTLDKLSSVGLFVLGLMAFAEACGVAVQSILTVGGIGGVATAFAARDVLGNVLSGLSLQFSKPFSLGDTIKAGTIEGQVVEMGLTTTSLLNTEKLPVIVPNSLFSCQVIVNKSRAHWCAVVMKIPLKIDDLEKIPQITDEIKIMLKSNSKVFLGKEAPYCFLSRIERFFAELTLGCNLKNMSKDEWYSTEQDILIQSARIIQQQGASLGSIP